MKRIFRLLKIAFISAIIGIVLSFTITNYLHSKMDNELKIYLPLANDMRNLNDMYSLCSGLLSTNPSNENINSCNIVYKNIEFKVNEIKRECPYISFYTKYLSKIE